MPDTLLEFLNENLHRNYPVMDGSSCRDVSDSYNIPTELIADIHLSVPVGSTSSGRFFISALVVRRYTIDLEIGYEPAGQQAIPIGWFHNIDAEATEFNDYSFTSLSQTNPDMAYFEDITGRLVAGAGLTTTVLPGSWEFLPDSTELVPTTLDEGLTKFRSLRVGSSVLTGDIILEEGDNVTITSSYDLASDTTTIKIEAVETQTSGLVINSDQDIIDALTDMYGHPITSINEIPPMDDGAFYLAGADCVSIGPEGSGLKIINPCGKPCCSEDSYLAPVYDSLNQLNANHVRLEDFLSGALDNTSSLLGRLKDLENSVGLGGF